MPLRRILVVLLMLMIVMSLAAGLSTRSDDAATVTRPLAPVQDDLAETLTVTLPRDRPVRAAIGDRIVLEVIVDAADQVQVEGYDLLAPVDPETPAQFDFVADQEGRFPVTLVSSGRVLGRVEVRVRP